MRKIEDPSAVENAPSIPVVCTDSTLQPQLNLISMTSSEALKQFTISVKKLIDPNRNTEISKDKSSRKFDKDADSSFSSAGSKKKHKSEKKVKK